MRVSCATIFECLKSHAYSDTENTRFGKLISPQATVHPGDSGFHLLSNGLDAFVASAVLIHSVERSIDVQYYLYHNDLVGRLFTDQLLKAADRGVRVRLLVDDMGLAGRDLAFADLDMSSMINRKKSFTKQVKQNFICSPCLFLTWMVSK